ncbi:junctional adhesion molecule A [Gastrophryne carolinensis]
MMMMAAGRKVWGLLGILLILCSSGALCDEEVSIKEGENAELRCNYGTMQTPRVEWKVTTGTDTILLYYDNELTAPYKGRVDVYQQGLRLNKATRKDSGEYACEVTGKDGNGAAQYKEFKTRLVVLVPPSVPVAQVPTSVSTGSSPVLNCVENDGSPPPTYSWYKNNVLMPADPKSSPTFQNMSYTLDASTGQLRFNQVQQSDVGEYYCEATNTQGKQRSAAVRMEVQDVNVGGIVAAVIVSLLILVLIAVAVWFAYRRGYIGKKSKYMQIEAVRRGERWAGKSKKVIYSQPSETRSDKNFQQTSSFLV